MKKTALALLTLLGFSITAAAPLLAQKSAPTQMVRHDPCLGC